jgi:hypothetical protein
MSPVDAGEWTAAGVLERAGPPGYIRSLHLPADGRLAVTSAGGAVGLVWSFRP